MNNTVNGLGGDLYMPLLTYRHNGPVWQWEGGLGHSQSRRWRKDATKGNFFNSVARRQNVTVSYDDIFYLGITVQLNPVSKETLAEVRRWISQGTGGGLDRGGVFFGSFVSVFVNPKIAEADRVLRIRSQPFFRPKP